MSRTHHDPVGALEAYAIVASSTEITAIKVAAPGSAPGQGGRLMNINRRLVQHRTEFLQRMGRRFAWENLKDKNLPLSILNGGLVADPAWGELITFTTTAPNRRGLAYSGARFMLWAVRVTYDHNTASCQEEWDLRRLLDAAPQNAIEIQQPGADPPTDTTEDYIPSGGTYVAQLPTPYEFNTPAEIVPDVVEEESDVVTDTMLAISDGKIYISSQLGQASPDWTLAFDPGAGWQIFVMAHDQDSDVGADDLRIAAAAFNSSTGQARIYYNGDVLGVGTWDIQQTLSNTSPAGLRSLAGVTNGWVIRGNHPSTGAATLYYTDDNFATVSSVAVATHPQAGGRLDTDDFGEGVVIIAVGADLYYTSAYDGSTSALSGITAISTDGFIADVRIPFRKILTQQLNEDKAALQFIVTVSEAVSGATTWAITFNANTGAVIAEVDITPVVSSTTYRATGTDGINTAGGNTQNILFVGHEENTSPSTHDVLLSEDGGETWALLHDTTAYEIGFFVDGSTSIVALWGGTDMVISLDKGQTLIDQYGDLPGTMGQNVLLFPT